MSNLSKNEIVSQLYKRGNLTFKLDDLQKEFYNMFHKTDEKIMVVLCSRRIGKSYFAFILALEQCYKKPKSVVKILAQTKIMINSILRPLFNEIIADCPEDMKPKLLKNQYTYYFPNGSVIELAGSDSGHAEKLRGGSSDLCIVDEAGFCNNLENTVYSVLLPTTLTTNGKVVLLTTPPEDLDHEFFNFMEIAEMNGSFMKKIIYDNKRLTQESIDKIISTYPGGVNNPKFRREFLCEIIRDDSRSVIPEFTAEVEKDIVKDWPTPPFYDCYESMDLGMRDLTVVLFGYYDFRAAKLIIQDELVVKEKEFQFPTFIKSIQDKEKFLWENPLTLEIKKPQLRVSDINYFVTDELDRLSHGEMHFVIAKKDDKDAQINHLRVMIQNKSIIINPRCQTLIRHLKNVRYKSSSNKTTFARSPDNGHYDAVDALIYFVRSVTYNRNPYPAHYHLKPNDIFIANPDKIHNASNAVNVFKQVFKNVNKVKRNG